VLEDLGHKVTEASDGSEALRVLKEVDCDFQLLITDYAMPRLSGTEFLRSAKRLCPDVPALIVTGYADADAIRGRPGAVEILQKPFTPAQLETAIERLCGAEPSTRLTGKSTKRVNRETFSNRASR
jgi:CheY-like chemotaxis protein